MEPITLITAALVAGATELSKGALGEAGKQLYGSLKSRIIELFAGDTHSLQILNEHEQDPETYNKPLVKLIGQAHVDKDNDVLTKAQELMSLLDQAGSAQGKYTIAISGGQGNQIGDYNKQENKFGAS